MVVAAIEGDLKEEAERGDGGEGESGRITNSLRSASPITNSLRYAAPITEKANFAIIISSHV
jgi:hypothetical protein